MTTQPHWSVRLTELAARHRVPGAALGILYDGLVSEAATGWANADARIEATTDTVWQIGSITKVWTATVVLCLAEAGLLDLDAPVVSVLPELRLADAELTQTITPRHLLSHTGGIDGDLFTDTGRGDDCLERYVALLADARVTFPLGATMSYCNAGYSLAGRMIEKVTGLVWDEAMREHLYEPLGLTHTSALPEDVLRFRAAIGHIGEHAAPRWGLPRSAGPAGTICSTAKDLLVFAALHLEGFEEMREEQVRMPDPHTHGDAWGLGWALFDWGGRLVAGHDGGTVGQSSFLRVLPDAGLAVCLLTNGGDADALYRDLFEEIFAELAGVLMPEPPCPAEDPPGFDLAPYTGVYARDSARITITPQDDGLMFHAAPVNADAALIARPAVEFQLHPVRPGLFVLRPDGVRDWSSVTFYTLPDGSAYLHRGLRATPKVG
ncbi:serine hydrolase domain-containing protein [Actinomadura rubrisoli]|nr:serine hydrolase domain-containing protein [Actinomadura rubrisoli]